VDRTTPTNELIPDLPDFGWSENDVVGNYEYSDWKEFVSTLPLHIYHSQGGLVFVSGRFVIESIW